MAGYTKDQTIKGVKSIDNWFTNNTQKETKKTWDNLTTETSSVVKGPQSNPLRYDKKFIEICREIPYSPKHQYQFSLIMYTYGCCCCCNLGHVLPYFVLHTQPNSTKKRELTFEIN